MRVGKRLLGLGLAVLGAIGGVICLAGIAGVWAVGSRLQHVNSKVFSQADPLIDQVDQRAARAGDSVGEVRQLADALKQTLRDSAKELVADRVASLPKIESLERRLSSAAERADGLLEVSGSAAEFIEHLLASVDSIASERNDVRTVAAELRAIVQSTRESLAHVAERLADVRRCVDAVRQEREVDVNLSQSTKLCLGIVAKLDVVQEQIAAFRDRLAEMKHRLDRLQDRIRTWVLVGQCLIVLLIAWGGAGQYCLLVRGWQILRQPSSVSG